MRTETGQELLDSQIAYYRAHASKYDDWWFHRGHHDLGDSYRESWNSQIERLRPALVDFAPFGDVLEFAGGPGTGHASSRPLLTR